MAMMTPLFFLTCGPLSTIFWVEAQGLIEAIDPFLDLFPEDCRGVASDTAMCLGSYVNECLGPCVTELPSLPPPPSPSHNSEKEWELGACDSVQSALCAFRRCCPPCAPRMAVAAQCATNEIRGAERCELDSTTCSGEVAASGGPCSEELAAAVGCAVESNDLGCATCFGKAAAEEEGEMLGCNVVCSVRKCCAGCDIAADNLSKCIDAISGGSEGGNCDSDCRTSSSSNRDDTCALRAAAFIPFAVAWLALAVGS